MGAGRREHRGLDFCLRARMRIPMCQRRCQSFFDRHSTAQSLVECCPAKANHFRPLSKRPRLAVECQQTVCPRVSRLFFLRCPAAISWFVIAVVVDAVKAVLRRRTQAHIRNEQLKIMPPLADSYAAPPVPLVLLRGRSVATVKHVPPNSVFGSAFHSVRRWATDRIRFSHDGTPVTRLVRTAMQLELHGRSYFSSALSSGATSTCSSF